MRCIVIFALLLAVCVSNTLGFGRAKEGKCPPLTEDVNCAAKLLDSTLISLPCTGLDLECPGDDKCCNDGCGGYECKPAIGLPPLPVVETACASKETTGDCEPANVTYCNADQCNKCCIHNNLCHPGDSKLITKDECEKKLCKDVVCPGQGEICKLDKYHRAICECPIACPADSGGQVCGSNGITYDNECEMNMSACVTGDRIDVVNQGICLPPTTPNPLAICTQKKEQGFGFTLELRYFFNFKKGICAGFIFYGKGGNENNFLRFKDCTDRCSAAVTDTCILPAITGPCRAAFPRWFFNSNTRRCEKFTFGGCAGNKNNFMTEQACNDRCVCNLPKAEGLCLAYFPSWWYNSGSGRCEKFVYGGCGGNTNRFYSESICQKTCGNREDPCAKKKCNFYSKCVVTKDNRAICDCPTICTADWRPVCASNNETYPNLCTMKTQSCEKQQNITKVRDGECDARAKSKCENEREEMERRNGLLVGAFLPQCNEDGSYQQIQCHGSTGYCWCVDEHGNKLEETSIRFKRPNCTQDLPIVTTQKSKCEQERDATNSAGLIGSFTPQCNEDGSYKDVQCHGSTGYCWCVDEHGNKLPETSIRFKRPNCTKATSATDTPPTPTINICDITLCNFGRCVMVDGTATCQCQQECPEIFAPICASDEVTYPNLCVMERTGCEISTRLTVLYNGECKSIDPCMNVTCPFYASCVTLNNVNTTCDCPLFCTEEFAPVCGSDGVTYDNLCKMRVRSCEQQKLITKQYNGNCNEAKVTERPATEPVLNPCDISLCNFGTCKVVNGSATCECDNNCPFIEEPICASDDKTYSNLCVMDAEACEREERLTVKHNGPCEGTKSKCQKELETANAKPKPGQMTPSCEVDGSYSPKQCHSSTGYCWCVTRQGDEIPDSKIRFAQPNCAQVIKQNPCENMKCDYYASCVPLHNGKHVCDCPVICTREYKPVCASNEKTYGNICEMKVASCANQELLTVVSPGECVQIQATSPPVDPCETFQCDFGSCMVINDTATCQCNKACILIYAPVCGSDNQTYPNLCALDSTACERKENITVQYNGACVIPEARDKDPCATVKCGFHSKCKVVDGDAKCVCEIACTKNFNPKCGSDDVTYSNPCELRRASCEQLKEITIVSDGECLVPTEVPTMKPLPKCSDCPIFGEDNIADKFCSWYNKFVIIGEIMDVNQTEKGQELKVKVGKRFKVEEAKNKLKQRNTVKIVVQKQPSCRCDNLEFKKNEKYVLMGRRSKTKIFVVKWKTGFVEKVSSGVEKRLQRLKKLNKNKVWGFCAKKRRGKNGK